MADLIDRESILAILRRERDAAIATSSTYGARNESETDEDEAYADNMDSLIAEMERIPTIKPTVVANITGGLLQGASADYPVDVIALDFEESLDPENAESFIELNADVVWRGQTDALVEPDFVKQVVEAPTMAERE